MQFFLWEFCKFEFKSTIYLLHQKDLPMQKKDTHKYTSVAVSYRNTMPYKISGLFTHFFERIYLRLFQFALLELSTKELQLQIKKLKSILVLE